MEQKLSMVKVQVTLEEQENQTVELVKALDQISSKEKAIKKIIQEYAKDNLKYNPEK